MTPNELVKRIQTTLNGIKKAEMTVGYQTDDWMEDMLAEIQHAINDYNNQEFAASEPDPFA